MNHNCFAADASSLGGQEGKVASSLGGQEENVASPLGGQIEEELEECEVSDDELLLEDLTTAKEDIDNANNLLQEIQR